MQWADVAGQGAPKAALEEELVWPLLRPPAYPGSPRRGRRCSDRGAPAKRRWAAAWRRN